ncbi:N-6 DNA methylase [Accumulibacter sp.]|uniref:N-6 DNA methylase n=1 Tax=Accumulibacter sp. TaxID=2053492 RepID=UPI003857F29C
MARMNLGLRNIDSDQIAHGDTFHNDRHADLKADFILANPPFNISDRDGERLASDKRWRYGVPPAGNANFASVQHIVRQLAPADLINTCFAGPAGANRQARRGRSKEKRSDCPSVTLGLVLGGSGFVRRSQTFAASPNFGH